MVIESIIEGWLGWNILSVGLSVLVVTRVVAQVVYWLKNYTFYHALPGSSDRSYFYGHIDKVVDGEDFIEFGKQKMEEGNGRYSCFWLSPFKPDIFIFHPELIQKVVTSSASKPLHMGSAYSLLKPWVGDGLIIANGAKWSRSRHLLTPAFHFDILKDFMPVYNEATDKLIKKLDKLAETGENFDICPLLALCTLEVVLKCSMGFEEDVQDSGHPYAQAAKSLIESLFDRARKPWLWPDSFFALSANGKTFYRNCSYVHNIAEEIIKKRKCQLEDGSRSPGRRMSFIDILLTARDTDGKAMTTTEMRDEVDTFMFAGHDTTATAIPWVLYTLAQHKEYQVRIQEEVDTIVKGRARPDILWQDLSKFEILSMCNKEVKRLYPPVPFIQRILDTDMDFDGNIITAGTNVTLAIVLLHRNPHIWSEPDEFRPERFELQNKSSVENYSYIPFSAGARNCIGQNFAMNEEKVVLAHILQRYKVSLAPDANPPKRNPTGVLKSESGIWLRLEKR